jgi:hypothetical protein
LYFHFPIHLGANFIYKPVHISNRIIERPIHLFTILLSVFFAFGCATSSTSDDQLAKLCAVQDLSQTSQRTALAGGYHALAKNDLV